MTVAFTDVLIELSDPDRFAEFNRDPEQFLGNACLTPQEKAALLSRNSGELRLHARSTDSTDPSQQFNRFAAADLVVGELDLNDIHDPEVELHLVEHDDEAIRVGEKILFVDSNGTLYQAVRRE